MEGNHAMRFRLWPALLLSLVSLLPAGCTKLAYLAHLYSDEAPPPRAFIYPDGGTALYYTFTLGDDPSPGTFLFFYGGSGCTSWKAVMPGYVKGFAGSARVFVLNKRHVGDRAIGLLDCGEDFDRDNHPDRWVSDYTAFIQAMLSRTDPRPRQVVLVGVSEGAIPAVRVASRLPVVTHLAIIGDGAWTLRRSLEKLKHKGDFPFDTTAAWQRIAADPDSLEQRWLGHPHFWWSRILDLDPVPDYLTLDIPVLVGMGAQDTSVPVESALALQARFQRAGKANLCLIVYHGADHRLQAGGTDYRRDFFHRLSVWLEGERPARCR